MKKTFLLFILALLPMLAMADGSGTCGDNVTWTYTESNKTMTIQGKGAMYDGDYYYNLFNCFWESYSIEKIIIGEGVTSIGDHAFYGCAVASIVIPNTITRIGNEAFANCYDLTSITIPNSVASIGDDAFLGCSGLASIIVENSNNKYDSRNNCNAIIESATNTLIKGCKTTIIPDNVTCIGDGAFSGCTGLTSITIPNSVASIGDGAFSDGTGITSVSIGNGVTSIGGSAFFGCSMSSIEIPGSVTSIGSQAFSACRKLTSIYSKIENIFTIDSDTFNRSVYENAKLYVPVGKAAEYYQTKAWNNFVRIIEYDYSTGIVTQQHGKDVKIVDSYLLNGQKRNAIQRGLNIIRMSDGTAKKVMLK